MRFTTLPPLPVLQEEEGHAPGLGGPNGGPNGATDGATDTTGIDDAGTLLLASGNDTYTGAVEGGGQASGGAATSATATSATSASTTSTREVGAAPHDYVEAGVVGGGVNGMGESNGINGPNGAADSIPALAKSIPATSALDQAHMDHVSSTT